MTRKKCRSQGPLYEHWYVAVEDWGFSYWLHLHDARDQKKHGRGSEHLHAHVRGSLLSPHPQAGTVLELVLVGDGKRIDEVAEGTIACGSVSKRRDGVFDAWAWVDSVALRAIETALAASKIKEVSLGVRDFCYRAGCLMPLRSGRTMSIAAVSMRRSREHGGDGHRVGVQLGWSPLTSMMS